MVYKGLIRTLETAARKAGRSVLSLESFKFSEDQQRHLVTMSQVCFHAFLLKAERIVLDLKSQSQFQKNQFFSRNFKKIHSIKSPTIPAPYSQHFLFSSLFTISSRLISPSFLVFWTISPSSLFCSSPLYLHHFVYLSSIT